MNTGDMNKRTRGQGVRSPLSGLRSVPPLVTVGLLLLAVVLLVCWPAPLHLGERLIGNNVDNWIFYWNQWWVKRALSTGQNLFFSPAIFFPQGADLVAHSNSLLNSLMAVLLEPLVGPVAAFNLVFLVGLWLGGVGMAGYVQRLSRSWPAALLAALVFTCVPYHLTEWLAHQNLGAIHWWPYYAWALHEVVNRPRVKPAILAGVFAALTLWSGLHLAVLLALWTLLYLVWHALTGRAPNGGGGEVHPPAVPGRWRYLGLLSAVTLVLCLPLILPILQDWDAVRGVARAYNEGEQNQTDLLAYWVPPTYHPLWGSRMQPIYERFRANRSSMPYLGYAALGLAALGIRRRWRATRFWLCSGLVWASLAAGSVLRVNGRLIEGVPLPFRWLGRVFPLSAIRAPDRFNLLLVFSLAVLAGWGAAVLAPRKRWLLPAAGLLVALEYLAVPLPMWQLPPVSPYLTSLAEQPTSGVVDFPMDYTLSKIWLYYQTIHGQPIVEGHVSRYTPETYAFVAGEPLLRAFHQLGEQPPHLPAGYLQPAEPSLETLGPALRSLAAARADTILVHTVYASQEQLEHLEQVLPLVPTYRDETLTAYDLERPVPVHWGEPIALAPHADLVNAVPSLNGAGSVHLDLLARLTRAGGPLSCHLALADVRVSVTFFPSGPAWQTGDLHHPLLDLALPSDLGPGIYSMDLVCDGSGAHQLADKLLVLEDGQRALVGDRPGVRYGDSIDLVGYQAWMQGGRLYLALAWQAQRSVPAVFKVFVHLLSSDGEIVRQHDAVPCNWTCPTNGWQPGQLVRDEVAVDLVGLPPGEYQVAVGLYDGGTGGRLPATRPSGTEIPDGYLVLPVDLRLQPAF